MNFMRPLFLNEEELIRELKYTSEKAKKLDIESCNKFLEKINFFLKLFQGIIKKISIMLNAF